MNIKVLGSGCSKCNKLAEKVHSLIDANGIAAEVEKITDIPTIMKYGVLSTPALVINEKVKVYGHIPSDKDILTWINEEQA